MKRSETWEKGESENAIVLPQTKVSAVKRRANNCAHETLSQRQWMENSCTHTHTHPTMESLWQRAKTMCASHDCNRGECGRVQMIKNGSRNSKETYSSRASLLFFALSHCQNVICYISFRIEFKSLPFLNRITKIGHNSLKYTSKTLILSWNDHLLS